MAPARRTELIMAQNLAATLHPALWSKLPAAEGCCSSSSPALQHLLASKPAAQSSWSRYRETAEDAPGLGPDVEENTSHLHHISLLTECFFPPLCKQ